MTDSVARARQFAVAAHAGQRYGDLPYSAHLNAVAALLAPYAEVAEVVGLLHDVVEDTGVPLNAIQAEFGEEVARLVALVTDEGGANRRRRKARTNAKLLAVGGDDALALVVKAADRLANLRASALDGVDSKLDMYGREHPTFRQATYRPELCDELWEELERIVSGRRVS